MYTLMVYHEGESYRMQVGKRAEKLIHEMMIELGFKVFHFGYEYIFPQLADRSNLLQGQAGQLIRSIPDFLIVDQKTNRAYLIEVKFRNNAELDENDRSDFPEMHIVLVSPQGISIADNNYIMDNPDNEECFCLLTEIGPFKHKNKDIIMKYVRKAREEFS
jgi:hypothetical protein